MAELFGHGPRTDRTARSFNEPMCAFIDRSGDPFFAEVRHLMTGWLGHVPSAHVADLRRRLQSKDDAQFESALLWGRNRSALRPRPVTDSRGA
jgi:hypothetical protein